MTGQIIITASLALLVFFTVIIYGFWKHGMRFLRLFVPRGIPIYILISVCPKSNETNRMIELHEQHVCASDKAR